MIGARLTDRRSENCSSVRSPRQSLASPGIVVDLVQVLAGRWRRAWRRGTDVFGNVVKMGQCQFSR